MLTCVHVLCNQNQVPFIQQVKDSAKLTRTGIKMQFAKLKDTLLKALEEREEELLSQVDEIEKSAMGPLLQCKEVIQQGIDTAVDVFKQG